MKDADTPKGAKASSILYSLVETTKVNQLEPYAYLTKVFTKIPYVQSVEDFEALLPWNIELSYNDSGEWVYKADYYALTFELIILAYLPQHFT